jgi:hypothetical protein
MASDPPAPAIVLPDLAGDLNASSADTHLAGSAAGMFNTMRITGESLAVVVVGLGVLALAGAIVTAWALRPSQETNT